MNQLRHNPARNSVFRIRKYLPTSAFTLVELLVVIGIIALLAAMLFPALSGARIRSYDADCSSNLKQIGVALYGYSSEYSSGYFPGPDVTSGTNSYAGPHTNLVRSLREYVPGDSPVWHCKRFLRMNDLTLPSVYSNTTYFFWGWNMYGNVLAPMTVNTRTSRWFTVGLSTNVPAPVLLSDRFETATLGDTGEKQYHAGVKVNVQPTQPGTMVLMGGGAAMKVSPTRGSIE